MKAHANSIPLWRILTWMTIFFILSQIIYFTITLLTSGILQTIIINQSVLQSFKPRVVWQPILLYLSCQAFLYILFTIIIYYASNSLRDILKLKTSYYYMTGITLWTMSVLFVMETNAKYFHQSIFAYTHSGTFLKTLFAGLYATSVIVLSLAAILLIANLIMRFYHRRLKRSDLGVIALIFICLAMHFNHPKILSHQIANTASTEKPNIILIIVESLRPDFVAAPNKHGITMPFVNNLINSSVQFTNAYTAIAQSFPSWMSLLTSKTPKHNGARNVYTDYSKIDFRHTISKQLQKNGYQTIFAVDGQRFSDISTELGFDKIISPPNGAAEIVIGMISDFPLSNLLAPTRLGKYLLPYSYANRGVTHTYQPQTFLNMFEEELANRNNKPLFLVAHFGLSHWPFRWANDNLSDEMIVPDLYRASLHAADKQIEGFYKILYQYNLFRHALVVVLSDHGIGLGLPGDSITKESRYVGNKKTLPQLQKYYYVNAKDDDKVKGGSDTSFGYSSNILSQQQYRAVLAFKLYGDDSWVPHQVTGNVSLMDIGTTIDALLKLPKTNGVDGVSLLTYLKHPSAKLAHKRELFIENGFSTYEMATDKISESAVLKSTINLVELDTSRGFLHLTDNAFKQALNQRHRGLIYDNWEFARIPKRTIHKLKRDGKFHPINLPTYYILADLNTGEWTADFNSSLAKRAPLKKLQHDFEEYNKE